MVTVQNSEEMIKNPVAGENIRFLNINFARMTFPEAVQLLVALMHYRVNSKVYYVNANSAVIASKNANFSAALNNGDLILADGSGVLWGSAFMGKPLLHNLNGTDLVPALCKEAAPLGMSVYLLGAEPGVADNVAENLKTAYPGLVIAGVQHGYFKPEEEPQVIEKIKAANPHLLLVAFGSPRQELWINQYAPQLEGTICMGVGGLFDFLSGRKPRAPRVIRKLGMEWVWRLLVEPRRLWRRYLIGNVVYIGLVAEAYRNRHKKLPGNVELISNYKPAAEVPLPAKENQEFAEKPELETQLVAYEQEKAV